MATVSRLGIGRFRVWVLDGLLNHEHISSLELFLKGAAYRRTEVATPETPHITHHAVEFSQEQTQQMGLVEPTLFALKQFEPELLFSIHRQYCNACYFGDLLLPHRDALPGQNDVTALWYLNAHWDLSWGGATQFFDEAAGTAIAVLPRPGRLVLFDGELLHVGLAPNRQCFEPRLTLAIKLFPKGT